MARRRMRTSSLYFAKALPSPLERFRVLFCSSMLNLAELVGACSLSHATYPPNIDAAVIGGSNARTWLVQG